MNRVTPKTEESTIYLSREGDLRPGETRQDECIRALFLATIALGTCLLVAACYHMPPNFVLGGTGLGVIVASMVANRIHDTRVNKRLQANASPAIVKATTLTIEGLTAEKPAVIRARIDKMTLIEKEKTRNILASYFAKSREAKISADVAEILIQHLGFDSRQISRAVKPNELSAYEAHPFFTLSPKEISAKIQEMSPTEIDKAREHVEENLKTLRVPIEIGYALVDHLRVDVTLVQDAEDPLCTRPYSLLEMGFQEIDQLTTATPKQLAELYAQMPREQLEEAYAFLAKMLEERKLPEVLCQIIAVTFMVDPISTQKRVEEYLKNRPVADRTASKTLTPQPPPKPVPAPHVLRKVQRYENGHEPIGPGRSMIPVSVC